MNKESVIDFFNHCAPSWDDNMITDNEKMNRILDAAAVGEGKSVLDIACGTGVMFPYYLERGATRITGVDIAPNMVEITKEKYRQNSKIDVLCADAETYSFDRGYDCCMVFNAFPHFCHPVELIENLVRALKAGGTLTVAHDRGRKALDIHHSGEASAVSCGLMSEDDLAAIFRDCGLEHISPFATDEIYIVSGIKPCSDLS